MKTKTKILTTLLATIGSITAFNALITNNNIKILNSSDKSSEISNCDNAEPITVDAREIGASKGTFTAQYSERLGGYTICKVSYNFYAYGNFNFNDGYFNYHNKWLKIVEIGDNAFNNENRKNDLFHNLHLTIPYTIMKIGDNAFKNCSGDEYHKQICEINFHQCIKGDIKIGVQYIGKSAFEGCSNIEQETIEFPYALNHIGNRAFVNTGKLKKFDLSELGHIIDVDCNPISGKGCLPTHQIKKIYFKNEGTKNLYLADKRWKSCAKYFETKNPPKSEITIDAKEFGAKAGTILLNVKDPDNVIVEKCSDDFYATGDFNFNYGTFIYDYKIYTITKIADYAFKLFNQGHYLFENCILSIPSTIKEIGKEAFADCSRLDKRQSFEQIFFDGNIEGEGVESIGFRAFANTLDKNSYHSIVLPSTMKYLGNKAFENDYLNTIYLVNDEEPIKVDSYILDPDGCFTKNCINKIYVFSEQIKERYSKTKYWKVYADIFEVIR